MSKTVYEVKAIVGKYKDKNGVEKQRHQHIGKVINTSKGLMLVLNMIPVVEGGWSGWSYLNEPREAHEQSASTPHGAPEDDDIPF
jgi:hypothetical protein